MTAPTLMATVLALVFGYSVLSWGTDGWAHWTSEAVRRQAVLDQPYRLPPYQIINSLGSIKTLTGFDRELTVIDLIYTNCPTVCFAMGAQFQRLQSDLSSAGLLKKVQLLSLTFDPANDHPPALAKYLSRFGALEGHWQAARFDEDEDLARALVDLGVVVIPDESVGFIHNAAFYLVENGRVVEIFNVDARDALYKSIVRRLTG